MSCWLIATGPLDSPLTCLPRLPSSIYGTAGHHVIPRNSHWNEGWMFHVWLKLGFSNTREQIKF